MVLIVAVMPMARAIWLSAASPAGVAFLASSAAPGVTALLVSALWAGALLLGRERGPVVRAPFLTHALAVSDQPRSATFRGPLLRAGAQVTGATMIIAALVAGSLVNGGLADPFEAALFVVAGGLTGIVATVAWLAGQALPRAALPIALGLLVLGAATAVVPVTYAFAPWGWVGLLYPTAGSPHVLVLFTALCVALVAAVPTLMSRLGIVGLVTQALRWDAATTRARGMDFSGATELYRTRPHVGRRIRAVRSTGHMSLMFLRRDAIGAARTPGRLAAGILTLAAAGALIALASVPTVPGWLLGGVAGLFVFAGLGPLTDGIRHAVSIASDLPLYGISDGHLLVQHALFPLGVVVVVLLAAATVAAIVVGIPAVASIVGALAVGLLGLVIRIGGAVKGMLPPALLAPMPTPMGDPSAAVRLVWALDGVLLAASAGAAAAIAFESPLWLAVVAATAGAIVIRRWRRRRL
ncbi:hypothetical protein ABCS02_25070 [Microbacterium sp. X-17]|uniref:hypothetical protein n=1 Tax=Microbacterium sp. X-17 TaxID=3144404 RepID=UPI0031F4E1BC